MPDIEHSYPYIMANSDWMQIIIPFLVGEKNENEYTDSVSLGLNSNDRVHEHLLASQSIISQFAFLENYEGAQFGIFLKDKVHLISADDYKLQDIVNQGINTLIENAIKKHLALYERQPVKKRLSEVLPKIGINPDKELIDEYVAISNRRIELAHNVNVDNSSMKEAVDIYIRCLIVAKELGALFGDTEAIKYELPSHVKIT